MTIKLLESDFHNRSISLQTREGNDIRNNQCLIISNFNKSQFPFYERYQALHNVIFKGKPSALYNCHGLTFASKRTCIEDDDEIRKILKDDNYIEITEEEAIAGDILLYTGNDGVIYHSSIVVEPGSSENFHIPKIYGKWGCFLEAIHYANVGPYNTYRRKYYRCY